MVLHYQKPGLDFENEAYVVIKEGRMRSKYFFADPKVIVTPPEKEITLPSEDVAFTVSTEQLDKLLKAAAIYQLPDLSAVGGNGVVKLLVRDKKNDTSSLGSVISFSGGVTITFGSAKKYFDLILPSLMTT